MAEIAPHAREQLLRRRAVHVDVVVVRKDELGETERVAWARFLADEQAAGRPPAPDSPVSLPWPARFRRRWRRSPCPPWSGMPGSRRALGTISFSVIARGGFQYGRKMTYSICSTKMRRLVIERLADDDVHAQRLAPVAGSVAQRRNSATLMNTFGSIAQRRQPAHALHRQLDLADAVGQRDVERSIVPAPITPSLTRP